MATFRLMSVATCVAAAVALTACSYPTVETPMGGTYSATYPAAGIEYGQITNIELVQSGGSRGGINVPGAVVGGIAGAALGDIVSGGRDTATVLGGAAGAVIGSQVGRAQAPASSQVFRVTIQTESGSWRTYNVPAIGELRVGDRVRVENGVIYRV